MDAVTQKLDNIDLDPAQRTPSIQVDPDGVPYVHLLGASYPPLADGQYDVIILSTGLEECILAGLLAVRGKKVLSVDRNAYYGNTCASLNLKELFAKCNKPFSPELERTFGSSRDYCIDLVPKLLLANGNLVKMLIQTGVTKYLDFGSIHGSYVYNSGRIYKLPVTPTEALTSSLVRIFQKPKLKSFAEFVAKYRNPYSSHKANTVTLETFKTIISSYLTSFSTNNDNNEETVEKLLDKFTLNNREKLIEYLEDKYFFPVFYNTKSVVFENGSLGLVIEGINTQINNQINQNKYFVKVKDVVPDSQAFKSNKIYQNDVIVKISDQNVLGRSEKEVKDIIVQSQRPLKIEFISVTPKLLQIFNPNKHLSSSEKLSLDLSKITSQQLLDHFGLDSDTANFLGHAMALNTTDEYLNKSAVEFVESCQLYAFSVAKYGNNCPYLYPQYGLSTIPEAFSRLASVYGSTVMLRTEISEILFDESDTAVGVKSKDGSVAKAQVIISDESYVDITKKQLTGKVVRSICVLKERIKHTSSSGDSCQIIVPAIHITNTPKQHDIYISMISHTHKVSPNNIFIAIASTTLETSSPSSQSSFAEDVKEVDINIELDTAFEIIGKNNIIERFDFVSETYEPKLSEAEESVKKLFVTKSLDATSHFESAAKDIMRVYKSVLGVELDLDEKIVNTDADQEE